MRVYLPATDRMLASLVATGELGAPPLTAFAVTAGLREWYVDEDEEELEYAASMEAARASLRLIDADPQARPRRVVVSADVEGVSIRDDLDRGVVRLDAPLTFASIAAVHIDDVEAERAIKLAAESITAAELGDDAAQAQVDDAEGFELAWYASQEIAALVELL